MKIRPFAIALVLAGISAASTVYAKSPVDELKIYLAQPTDQRPDLSSQPFASQPVSKTEAAQAKQLLWDDHLNLLRATRQKEWDDQAITIGTQTLRLKSKHVGAKPKAGWNLFISMHGGGQTDPAVNDQQWENQIRLYDPPNSLYVAPRAPTNTWNLWHEDHIDGLFTRLIEDAIALEEVDPNHVYIMGYSAGGDGVYQLAPRMADSLAAAAMMAGHPNDASPLGLRNLPFTIHVGALDDGYHRNQVALQWGEKLDQLQNDDPQGYVHEVKLHKGRAHWMNREDAVAVDWMEKYTRNPLPDKVVWMQGNKTHDRFYWLSEPEKDAKKGQLIIASRDGQNITVEKTDGVTSFNVMLNDAMLDMDKPVHFHLVRPAAGQQVEEEAVFNVSRKIKNLYDTLAERGDPELMFSGTVAVPVAN